MSGSITRIGPPASDASDAGEGQRIENKGMVTFEFTALASVKTNEHAQARARMR